jgi:low affinity Fe/Cu permease
MKSGNGTPLYNVWFAKTAAKAAGWVGSPWAFTLATLAIALWAASGTYFHYSDTWQLVINTATTIITFLVVFLIQNTQNRNDRAVQLKLDEVIRSIRSAHNEMIDIEELSDPELEKLAKQYHRVREAWELRRANKRLPNHSD